MRLSNSTQVREWLDREMIVLEAMPNGELAELALKELQSEQAATHIIKVLLGVAEILVRGDGDEGVIVEEYKGKIFDVVLAVAAARVECREQMKAGNIL